MKDIIIIGGGPAGLTAGIYAARAGASALLLEAGFAGGQAATTSIIENYPGFAQGIGGPELSMEMERQATHAGLEIQYGRAQALTLGGDIKTVEMGNKTLEARAIILAMGAQPRRLGIPGEDALTGRGVSWCATCDGALYRGKQVVVIGGGNSAVEQALYLAAICDKVTLIHRRDSLRAEHTLTQRILQEPKVEILWNSVVQAFSGTSRLEGLRIASTEDGTTRELAADGAFVAAGTLPNTALAKGQVDLDAYGYVLAGEDTRTSLPRVYAAGDLRAKVLRQVVTAVADGAVAATVALEDLRG